MNPSSATPIIMWKYLVCFLAPLILYGCGGGYKYPPVIEQSSSMVRLESQIITRDSSATVQLECLNFSEFQILPEPTFPSDSSWLPCRNGTYQVPLIEGPMNYKLWVRSSDGTQAAWAFEANYVGSEKNYNNQSISNAATFGNLTNNRIAVLNNNLIAIADPAWNSNRGSVTILSPSGRNLYTIEGARDDQLGSGGDQLGSGGVYALADGRFLINSPLADSNGSNSGQLELYNTSYDFYSQSFRLTLVSRVVGPEAGAFLGETRSDSGSSSEHSGVFYFPTIQRIIVACPFCNGDNGESNNGKVYFFNSLDLSQTRERLLGPSATYKLSYNNPNNQEFSGIIPLGSTRFAILNPSHVSLGSIVGKVDLYSALDGNAIGDPFIGTTNGNRVGSGGIYPLNDGSYAVVSPHFPNSGSCGTGAIHIISSDFSASSTALCSSSGTPTPDKLGELYSNIPLPSVFPTTGSAFGILSQGSPLRVGTKSNGGVVSSVGVFTGHSFSSSSTARVLQLSDSVIMISNPEGTLGNGAIFFASPTSSSFSTGLAGASGSDAVGSGGIYRSPDEKYCAVSSPRFLNAASTFGEFRVFACDKSIGGAPLMSLALTASGPNNIRVEGTTSSNNDFGFGGVYPHPNMKVFILGNPVSKTISLVPHD